MCVTDVCIFSIIISKLGYWKEFYPSILFIVDKNLELGFHHTILFFGLAVSLFVKYDKKSLLDTKEIA